MDGRDRWLLAWGLGYVAVGAASLLFPLYALALGGGAFLVGVLAASAAFAGVPGALLWGWLAGRTGRRRVFVVVALASTSALLAVTPLVQSAWPLLAVNTLLWFVVSAAAPVLNLLVVEGTPEQAWESRVGELNAWQQYGWVGGLVLGSAWIPLSSPSLGPAAARTWLFLLCSIAAGVGALLSIRWLPRESRASPESFDASPRLLARIDRGAGRYVRAVPFATTRLYWALRSIDVGGLRGRLHTRLRLYLLAVGTFSAGFAAFWGPLPAFLSAFYPDEQVFWFFLASNVGAAAAFTRTGGWATDRGGTRLQRDALAARVVLFPAVAVVVVAVGAPIELPLLLAVFAVIGVTWAIIAVTATALVTRLSGGQAGTALGVYAAVAGLGGGIGSVLGGWVAAVAGFAVTFGVAAGVVLASLLLVVGFERSDDGESGDST